MEDAPAHGLDQSLEQRVDRVVRSAAGCQPALRDGAVRAAALRALADVLDAHRERIIATTSEETHLTPEELAPEFRRMVGTMRLFAEVVTSDRWKDDAHSPPDGPGVGPTVDLWRVLVPLSGVVAVFGASNFPLAYGTLGGDTASALAAGCPVVVKEHPAHRRTARLLADLAGEALSRLDPRLASCVAQVPHDEGLDPAAWLVGHGLTAAVGFTGSVEGGNAVAAINPMIPCFAEMGSANVVAILPGALATRPEGIAQELAGSILARHGQQCTKPGVLIVPEDDEPAARRFMEAMREAMDAAPIRRMLSPRVAQRYHDRCRSILDAGAELRTRRHPLRREPDAAPDGGVPMLVRCRLTGSCGDARVLEEAFGPASVVVSVVGGSQGVASAMTSHAVGRLVTSIYADAGADRASLDGIVRLAAERSGRVVLNGVPTGVRVAEAMVHGGPRPATNRPESTAVGPRAILRWCRPVAFQGFGPELLRGVM